MTINYLYLDDEPPTEVEAYIRHVKAHLPDLEIEQRAPKQFTEQMDLIQKRQAQATTDEGLFHGLILDFRLSEKVDWSAKNTEVKDAEVKDAGLKAGYNAPTLAQEIRNRATDLLMRSFPIVLWSTDEKLNRSYWKDDTSHDLFDARVIKQQLIDNPEYAKATALKLASLVTGYKEILDASSTTKERPVQLLRVEGVPLILDPRIAIYLIKGPADNPAHEQARFIISQLLETPNSVLIDKRLLAARLGIDTSEGKSPGLTRLVDSLFLEASYKGPFSTGWPCWWLPLIEQLWDSWSNTPGSLRELTAEERVAFLKEHSGINDIEPAQPIDKAEYTCFWTICQATLKPLDARDGFIINRPLAYPWQEPQYVSFHAVIEGIAEEKKISLDPLEESRYQRVKKRFTRR